jgi:hypothetical protein
LNFRRLLNILILVLLIAAPTPASPYDFTGENLTYEFGWNGITAADAQVKIAGANCEGSCQKATIDITGRKYLDMFWKVRDRIESTCAKNDYSTKVYSFFQREGQYNLDTVITLDKEAKMLRSKRYRTDKNKKYKDGRETAEGVYDPLAALLYMRSQPLLVGDDKTIKVFDGKRTHWLNWKVLGKEKISTKLGDYDALKVAPRIIKSNETDSKSKVEKVKKVMLWLSDDPAHTVLRIESEAFVGHIFAELVSKN